jgi:spermidine/putrescine transport system permease protein
MKRISASLTATVVFLYLPLAVLVVFSFNRSPVMAFPLAGFTVDWYRSLAGNHAFINGFITSFLISQPVGILGMVIGLAAALALTASGLRWRLAFVVLLLVPFLVPKSVLSIAQVMLMSRIGLERGATALILAQTLVVLPFATAIIAAAAMRLDPGLEEAARDLGATPWQSFRRVVLPQLKSALGAAYSVGVILSLADLAISMFLAGRVQPLSLIVVSQFRRELSPDLNAMQVVVLILTALLVAANELSRRHWSAARRRRAAAAPTDAFAEVTA